jgi:hypothetical protein
MLVGEFSANQRWGTAIPTTLTRFPAGLESAITSALEHTESDCSLRRIDHLWNQPAGD